MPANRISEFVNPSDEKPAEQALETPPGFAAVPLKPLKQAARNCQEAQGIYELAYLFARMGFVAGK